MANYNIDGGYYHAMDREYNSEALMPIKDIGVSIMATKDALQPLMAKIREGASKVEIGFLGRDKGSIFSGQINPESIDKEQREAIRLLSKVNKVELSTHATVATGGFAGFSNRGFNDEVRMSNIHEIKRAIEFAADTAGGGAITMHADEFPRPIFNVAGKEGLFKAHPEEEKDATFYLVDDRTGDIIHSVRKNVPIHMPVIRKDAKGNEVHDAFGNPIPEIEEYKVGDKTHTRFKVQEMDWKKIEEETARRNATLPDGQKLKPEQVYYKLQGESKLLQLKGEELKEMREYDIIKERRDRIVNSLEKWKAMEDAAGPNKEKLAFDYSEEGMPRDVIKPKHELPTVFLERQRELIDRQIAGIEQRGIALRENILDIDNQLKRLKPITDFATQKSADSIARAGLYAYDVEKSKGLKRDLFVAPEGLFPEKFGSHPDEIRTLIQSSREKMAEMLTRDRGMNSHEAQKIADNHIKATVDIGHVNVWKKYFERKPGESLEQSDARFNKWLVSEIKDLADKKIIGHIHISDNFGYQDEHLTPGQGSVPIKAVLKELQASMKEGAHQIDFIVEPGAQDPAKQYEALYGGWKLFGHSIYGLSAPGQARRDWKSVEHAYFGQNAPPYFLFGDMVPSDEYRGQPFWTGLGLE